MEGIMEAIRLYEVTNLSSSAIAITHVLIKKKNPPPTLEEKIMIVYFIAKRS